MPNFFYFDQANQKQGPVNEQQIKALVVQGIITPQTQLETDTGKKGLAGQIKGLFPAAQPPFSQTEYATTPPPTMSQFSTSVGQTATCDRQPEQGGGKAVASLVCGIVSVLTCGGFLILPIVGLILGILGLKSKRSGMATTGVCINAVVVAIGLLAIIAHIAKQGNADYPVAGQQQMGNEAGHPVAEQQQREEAISVSATDLMQAYEDNQIAADAMYKGKTLIVKGTINKMVSGEQPSVLFDTNNLVWGVQCYFSSGSESSLASLRTGQTVFIKGKCNGRRYNAGVTLQDCSIVSAPSETSPSPANENAENETNRSVPTEQPQAKIAVTSVNLMQAYEDNQIAADAKYKGKTLVVRGTINKMVSGSPPSVLLDTNNIAWGVQCVFSSESASSLASLRTGQTVVIEGTCNGRRYSASVVLQDCSLVQSNNVRRP